MDDAGAAPHSQVFLHCVVSCFTATQLRKIRFVRGFDPQGTNDPDGQNRTIESVQLDSVGPHAHTMGIDGLDSQTNTGGAMRYPDFAGGGIGGKKQTDNNSGVETRPKNVALLYCILK